MTGRPDNALIKAATGLEGGCVACGSTCGVVTGAALGLALEHEAQAGAFNNEAAQETMAAVNDFVRWFQAVYGTALCRERTRTDFYSIWGQIKYFLTFYRMAGCFRHIRGTMRHLHEGLSAEARTALAPLKPKEAERPASDNACFHCAGAVLKKIREHTGIGNSSLEGISFVFDGGVGFSGGLCGALAGAVMGINILVGVPVREQSFWKTALDFSIGHVNLVKAVPLGEKDPFAAGKQIIRKFKETAGALECRSITGREFSGADDFQAFIRCSDQCREIMNMAADEAIRVIHAHQ
jgi:C_GCAxxG_C_C family probable redox protein